MTRGRNEDDRPVSLTYVTEGTHMEWVIIALRVGVPVKWRGVARTAVSIAPPDAQAPRTLSLAPPPQQFSEIRPR